MGTSERARQAPPIAPAAERLSARAVDRVALAGSTGPLAEPGAIGRADRVPIGRGDDEPIGARPIVRWTLGTSSVGTNALGTNALDARPVGAIAGPVVRLVAAVGWIAVLGPIGRNTR